MLFCFSVVLKDISGCIVFFQDVFRFPDLRTILAGGESQIFKFSHGRRFVIKNIFAQPT